MITISMRVDIDRESVLDILCHYVTDNHGRAPDGYKYEARKRNLYSDDYIVEAVMKEEKKDTAPALEEEVYTACKPEEATV